MRIFRFPVTLVIALGWLPGTAGAAMYYLPPAEFSLVGMEMSVTALQQDTLIDIARRNDVGQEAIVLANPEVDRWLPGAGTRVVLPSRHILPDAPREGLVLNLPEMRVYYYPKPARGEEPVVYSFPVGIGRMDWETPLGETRVISKQKDPSWTPPESIRREHAEQGDPLPRVVPPGPDNPLGRYALRLGIPGYLMHGTNKEFGVGMQVSHGCVRLLPENIETLYETVPVGTPVRIINQPVKVGWYGDELYIQVYPPLEGASPEHSDLYTLAENAVDAALFQRPTSINVAAIERELARPSGLPVKISGSRIPVY
ncbi:L,D-transpeptidase family protein [Haliea sp. E17]|uniref:L,D-transpeptidase family protein n=1 Tax=Haliea sp. E17 TaxID=3401576 RepID=UPI003AAC98E5